LGRTKKKAPPVIFVLSGVNGSGKSSVGGAMVRKSGAKYFNPDEAAYNIMEANPGCLPSAANIAAWLEGKRLLEQAIAERLDYTFETTLGGETITELLEYAAVAGINVWVWYVGLDSPERCVARVKERVATGGHDIPEEKIRERYIKSPLNLIRLLPHLSKLVVFDNTEEGDPQAGKTPQPRLLLKMEFGQVIETWDLKGAPDWAKPILITALKLGFV